VQVVDKSWSGKETTVGSVALQIKDLRMLTGLPVRRLREHNIISANGDGTPQNLCIVGWIGQGRLGIKMFM